MELPRDASVKVEVLIYQRAAGVAVGACGIGGSGMEAHGVFVVLDGAVLHSATQ